MRGSVALAGLLALALAVPAGADAKGTGPSALAARGRTAWVGTGTGRVWRIGPNSVRRFPLRPLERGFVHGLRLGFGSLWMVDGRRLVRASSTTGRIEWSRRGAFYDIALGGRSVWVGASDGSVRRYSPVSERYVGTVQVPGVVMGLFDGARGPLVLSAPSPLHDRAVMGPAGRRLLFRIAWRTGRLVLLRRLACDALVAEGRGTLWIADACRGRVYGIDPRNGHLRTRAVRVPRFASALTFAGGALWVVTRGCGVRRIDPARVRVVAALCAPGSFLAAGTTYPWLLSWGESPGDAAMIDPTTNRVARRIRIPPR